MLVEMCGNFLFDVTGKKLYSWLNGMLEIVSVSPHWPSVCMGLTTSLQSSLLCFLPMNICP